MNRIITVLLALICMTTPAMAADWQQFHYDVTNIGTTASDAPDDNALLWTSEVIGAIDSSSTVIAEGKVFVYCNGALKALDEFSGAELWSVPIPSGTLNSWASPAYHDGCVFISAGTNVSCRHASNGSEKWIWAIPSEHESCNGGPTVADGKVVVGDWDGGHYYCIDEATGTNLLWTKDVAGYAQGTAAYADGNFYLTSWVYVGGHVYSVASADGSENWHTSTPEDIAGSVALSTELGLLYFATYEFFGSADLYALYMINGSEKWSHDEIISGTDSTPAVSGEYIYFCAGCTGYSDLYTYCYYAGNGTHVWNTSLGDGIGSWTCSVAVADDKVFVGNGSTFFGHDGLCALDATPPGSDAVIEWGSNVGGASPAVADGIVFTIADGRVYAFGTPATVPQTPLIISGEVSKADSTSCNDPSVLITNTATGKYWNAETLPASNYYRLVISSDNVSDGNILRIDASGCSQSTTMSETVSQDDIDDGGLFGFDITLGPIITSCDDAGDEKNEFYPGENVSVTGTGLAPDTWYTIWIQDDPVGEGDLLPTSIDPSGSQETVQTNGSGNFGPELIWSNITGLQKNYDIVVDNQDGTYNAASDGIDSATGVGIVAPVSELATITLIGIGLMMLVGVIRYRRE